MASDHYSSSKQSQGICDVVFGALARRIPNLERSFSMRWCGIYKHGGKRFAFVNHRKTMDGIEIWLIGDPVDLKADTNLDVRPREGTASGWREFASRVYVDSERDALEAARLLHDYSYPSSVRRNVPAVATRPVARSRGVRIPSDEELRQITTRGVAEIIPHEEFLEALQSGRQLRLKMGFDPTRPVITLGWAVGLRKLRKLQDLGHKVVIIIGDWTARIGDPSGQSRTRRMRSTREVRADAYAILDKFYTILDPRLTEVRWQREWFDNFQLTKLARLASHVTVSKMLERDDFEMRYKAERPIHLQEFLYPLLQAYDSVEVRSDVEFGGTDQKFNILLGREIQPKYHQTAQYAFLVPLLIGLDGTDKMSQSLNNFIAIDDEPHDMFGKVMSIADPLVGEYFELLTDVPDDEIAGIRGAVEGGGVSARDAKMRLAREIVSQFHGEEAGEEAEDEFRRVFRDRQRPKFRVVAKGEMHARALGEPKSEKTLQFANSMAMARGTYSLPYVMHQSGLVESRSEARRLIEQGAVEINGHQTSVHAVELKPGDVVRIGKHRFLQIIEPQDLPDGARN